MLGKKKRSCKLVKKEGHKTAFIPRIRNQNSTGLRCWHNENEKTMNQCHKNSEEKLFLGKIKLIVRVEHLLWSFS